MTAERRAAAIAETIEVLGWCVTIPHTIDQIIGIYAERTSGASRAMRSGMTNDEILSRLTAKADSGGGKGGHSDPTAMAALWGEPDAVDDDETVATIRAAVALCHETATEIATICADTLLSARWTPPAPTTLTSTIAATVAHAHRWTPQLEHTADQLHGDELAHLDCLVRVALAETAAWLHAKALGIWDLHRGETLTAAVQRTITPCACCSTWGYQDHAMPNSDLCETCAAFRFEYKCWPTKSIRDDRAMGRKRISTAQIDAARKAGRKRSA